MSFFQSISPVRQNRLGAAIFRMRLFLGLAIAVAALEWIEPVAPFGPGHRAVHAFALALVALGLVLRGWASGCAGVHTRSSQIAAPQLVTGGPFAHVRNPIYCGSAILSAGMVLLIGDIWAVVIGSLTLFFLFRFIIPAEEAFLLGQFGDDYRHYCAGVPRWVPQWRAWPESRSSGFRWRAVTGEFVVASAVLLIYAALLLEEHFDQVVLAALR